MKTGIARMHDREAGALSIYIDREVGELVTLPKKTKLKAVWDGEKEELTIKKMD